MITMVHATCPSRNILGESLSLIVKIALNRRVSLLGNSYICAGDYRVSYTLIELIAIVRTVW